MQMSRSFQILARWFVVGVIFIGLTFGLNPMPGLALLMLLVGACMIVVAPAIHILLAKRQQRSGSEPASAGTVFLVSAGAILALIILLGATGFFHFT